MSGFKKITFNIACVICRILKLYPAVKEGRATLYLGILDYYKAKGYEVDSLYKAAN